jgi:hypothetical protein
MVLFAGTATLAALACSNDSTAPALATMFAATMNGANERLNPVTTTATGSATFTIDESAGTIAYAVTVNNIVDVIACHIHAGRVDVAGPIVVNLCTTTPASGTINGTLVTGTITAASIGASVPISFASLVSLIRNGDAYINVHTQTNPGGEIRGQILAQ